MGKKGGVDQPSHFHRGCGKNLSGTVRLLEGHAALRHPEERLDGDREVAVADEPLSPSEDLQPVGVRILRTCWETDGAGNGASEKVF